MAQPKLALSPKTLLQLLQKFSSSQTWSLLIGIVAVGVLLTGIWAVWKIPQQQVGSAPLKPEEKARIDAETAARVAIIQGLGGLLLFGTAGISWLNLRETQRNVLIAQRNTLIAEEKQVTERFSKAVEMLGNENSIHIRLGGIYALERIANDSDKDYWQVMEVLTAFVRERSPYPPRPKQEDRIPQSSQEQESNNTPLLPTDIQAVLTVIERRKYSYENGEKYGLDLTATDLRGANLGRVKLQGAILVGTKLQRAILVGTKLQRAILVAAELQGAKLWRAELQGADLLEADLQGADLLGTDLQRAILRGANLRGAELEKANLQGADLKEALHLTQEQLDQTQSYEGAILPEYIRKSASSND